jgi:hypothetical protein
MKQHVEWLPLQQSSVSSRLEMMLHNVAVSVEKHGLRITEE